MFYIIWMILYDTIDSMNYIRTINYIESISCLTNAENGMRMSEDNGSDRTSIQITARTRDRLYRLKFRRTYDQFLDELCDMYEKTCSEEGKTSSQSPP